MTALEERDTRPLDMVQVIDLMLRHNAEKLALLTEQHEFLKLMIRQLKSQTEASA